MAELVVEGDGIVLHRNDAWVVGSADHESLNAADGPP